MSIWEKWGFKKGTQADSGAGTRKSARRNSTGNIDVGKKNGGGGREC